MSACIPIEKFRNMFSELYEVNCRPRYFMPEKYAYFCDFDINQIVHPKFSHQMYISTCYFVSWDVQIREGDNRE